MIVVVHNIVIFLHLKSKVYCSQKTLNYVHSCTTTATLHAVVKTVMTMYVYFKKGPATTTTIAAAKDSRQSFLFI